MEAAAFLKARLETILNYRGEIYEFYGTLENAYHERITGELHAFVRGIYHEQNSYETQVISDGSITHSFPSPMILCMLKDAEKIEVDDRMKFESKFFVVVAKNDIQNYGIACDISLREVEPWLD